MYILGIIQIWAWVKLGALKYLIKPGWSWYMARCQTRLKSVVLWVLCFEPYPGDTDTVPINIIPIGLSRMYALFSMFSCKRISVCCPLSNQYTLDEHVHSLWLFSSVVASLLNIMLIVFIYINIYIERGSFSVCIWEGVYSCFFPGEFVSVCCRPFCYSFHCFLLLGAF